MSKFIPGGFEDSEDSDYDDLVYDFDPLRKPYNNRVDGPLAKDSFVSSPWSDAVEHQKDTEEVKERKAFLWPDKPDDRSRSPSPTPVLALDDIRSAVINGNIDFLRNRLDIGETFFVDTVLHSGWTALMYASSRGHPDIVHYLLENKADPNFHKDLFTPLMAACSSTETDEKSLLDCVKYLLKFGANCDAVGKFGDTPLLIAAKQGKPLLVKEVLDHGANINHCDKHGSTALHNAAYRGHGSVIRVLLESRRADLNKANNYGQTAADSAFDGNHAEIGNIIKRLKNETNNWELNDDEISSLENPKKPVKKLSEIEVDDSKKRYIDDLEHFLMRLNLREYKEKFEEHRLTMKDVMLMTEDDLEKIGIEKLGVRKKLMDGIVNAHKASWKEKSLANLKQHNFISCPEAVAMMANISKHLAYIETTVAYLRQQIKKNPKILECGQEASDVQSLVSETKGCLANSRVLFDEVKFFGKDLDKVKNNPLLNTADLIGETDLKLNNNDRKWMSAKIFIIGGGILITTYFLRNHLRTLPLSIT